MKSSLLAGLDKTGTLIRWLIKGQPGSDDSIIPAYNKYIQSWENTLEDVYFHNRWFTRENVVFALEHISNLLCEKQISKWLSVYSIPDKRDVKKRVAVIMAGNIPLAGFHDMLCVLCSGHTLIAKPSEKDKILTHIFTELICEFNPGLKSSIEFSDGRLNDFDAMIASGADETGDYFRKYFGKYPNIIRGHKNSIAILSGDESPEKLSLLTRDIFMYFGMGCRSVSKLYLPEGYDLNKLFDAFEPWNYIYKSNKYANNYDYHKSVYLMNKIKHLDNGFTLLKEDHGISSPLAVIFYEYYSDIAILAAVIGKQMDQIQCIVSERKEYFVPVPFGETQKPDLSSYPDNIDTMDFLINL